MIKMRGTDQFQGRFDLLETDYDHPSLAEIKKHFSPFGLAAAPVRYNTEEEKQALIRENIGVAIDFYRRFAHRLEQMMRLDAHFDRIFFTGP